MRGRCARQDGAMLIYVIAVGEEPIRRNWGPKSFCGEASDSPRLGVTCLRSVLTVYIFIREDLIDMKC